ncbi:muts domain V-domain-containing protein [Morchella snyderi]|nr:muts domain V-domain-containing protein [Morchella snyderi]
MATGTKKAGKPSSQQQQPAQRTISSFFTPRPAAPGTKKAAPAAKKQPPPSPSPSPEPEPEEESSEEDDDKDPAYSEPEPEAALPRPPAAATAATTTPHTRARRAPLKRVLPEDDDSDDNDLYSVQPPAKRRGRGAPVGGGEAGEAEADDERECTVLVVPAGGAAPGRKAASGYRFGSQKEGEGGAGERMQVDGEEEEEEEQEQGQEDGKKDEERKEDEAIKRRKAQLHRRFVQKLGRPDSVLDARRDGDEEEEEGGGEEQQDDQQEDDEDDSPGPIAKRFGKGAKKTTATSTAKGKKPRAKLTPLEQQVVDIKRQNPDTLLLVEVGYKYRFFGQDARIASTALSIMCIPGKLRFDDHPSEAHLDRFASASIPVPRLHVHVKRLVAAGHKVGVVRQRETAALKAAGDNRNAPFVRELAELYTKGTYIDDADTMDDVGSTTAAAGAQNTGYILCITEKPGGGTGTDEKAHVGIVAVQPATGDVVYDEFDDGFTRSEIETRLLHIAPCELLVVGELTRATEKIVTHLAGGATAASVFGDAVRIERVPRSEKKGAAIAHANAHVAAFYADKLKAHKHKHNAGAEAEAEAGRRLDDVVALPDLATVCLSALITHLTAYGLEHVFDLTAYFAPFSARGHMHLAANTLASLEIYRNQTDNTTHASLFWALDRTRTKPGRRLLRKWVGRPLLQLDALEARIAAVEEILAGRDEKLERVRGLLARVGADLEKGLIRIYYGKCTRPELLATLLALERIAGAFEPVGDGEAVEEVGFGSRLLNEAVAALPRVRGVVAEFLGVMDQRAAARDDRYAFFRDESEYEDIVEYKLGIAAVEAELKEHLKEIAKTLRKPKVIYVSVSGVEYLIEVPNDKTSLSLVPATWAKISGTKRVSRFHTPTTTRLLRERDQHKESLTAACNTAYATLLAQIAAHYHPLRDTLTALATLDCLFSLAAVAAQPGYCKPTFTPATPTINIVDARHPMIEKLLATTPYIPTTTALAADATRALVITGPNMGGKSSYLRMLALIAIMAQIGSYVPAAAARLGVVDAVYTRMGARDNMMNAESTFMVELTETAAILRCATARSLVVLDELGRGTSTCDGVAIAGAVLECVLERGCLCLFATHYAALAGRAGRVGGGKGVAARFMRFEVPEDGSDDITFLYELGEGVASRSYGLNVARLAGLPERCLAVARQKSAQLEAEMKERETMGWAKAVLAAVEGGGEGGEGFDAERLLAAVEYLQ